MKKVWLLVKSLYIYITFKIKYCNKLQMHPINSIRGSIHFEIFKDGNIKIGTFLMSRGPLYLKCTDNGTINIGERVFFNHNCSITAAQKVSIGNHVMIANNVVIVDHDHVMTHKIIEGKLLSSEVVIDDYVWIGANSVILQGVHIGEGAVIGAGSVVTKDIPAHSIAVGSPAKVVRSIL